MSVTVVIKALNEEGGIGAAIASALEAVRPFAGEVLLADSGSTDNTITIARALPVRVVQLAEPDERSCGAGAQLAFQNVTSTFFYLMDGDMTLVPGFLARAMAWLEAHPDFAGVGGQVIESVIENEEFRIRQAAMEREAHRREGAVDRLDGGGLYRTEAIRSVGHLADRNLASFEEFELAARLLAQGWRLARIAEPAVIHAGHRGNGYRLMWARLRSGQLGGVGQVLRAAWGRPHWRIVVARLGQIRIIGATIVWWLMLLASALAQPWALLALLPMPVILLAARRRSLGLGLYSFCYWNLAAAATIRGFLKPRTRPDHALASVEISPRGSLRAPGSD